MVSGTDRIPVAVIGTGSFGRHHARVYASLPEAELVAVVDREPTRARRVAAEFGCKSLTEIGDLPRTVRAVSLAVPTSLHATAGIPLLEQGIDLLIEKPIAAELACAESLVETAARTERVLQVGHLERFNPVVEAATAAATLPLFFEVHRMSPFSPRSLDIDVILDLMIHDIDIVRTLVDSDVQQIDASGLSVVSDRTDIANARIQFQNGCVANLTASRVSTEKIRKLRFFQPRTYVSVDYFRRRGVCIGLDHANRPLVRPLLTNDSEPLRNQLRSFLRCVRDRTRPRVDGHDGLEALRLALRIREAIHSHSLLISQTLAASS